MPDFDSYGRAIFERQGLRFRFGPVHLRLELGTSIEYNDNIFGTYLDPTADIIARITPLIRLGIGDFQAKIEDYFVFEYQPSYQNFFLNPDQNHISQNLHSSGKASFSRYSTDFELDYLQDNQPTATQSGRRNYQFSNFTWNNIYYLGAKTFASAAISVAIQNYEGGPNYATYSISPQLGYAFSPKTTVFAGPYAGIALIGDGATQTFEGLTLGFSYDTLRKLTLNGSVGIQARQFQGLQTTGNTSFTTPIFNLGAGWTPTSTTTFRANLGRSVEISDLGQGLTYTNTAFTVSWRQQFLQKFSFGLGAGYQYLDYQSNPLIYPNGRIDQFLILSPTLSYSFWHDQISVDLYYQRQQRISDLEFFGYTLNLYGLRLVYKF